MTGAEWLDQHGRYKRTVGASDLRRILRREKKHCTWCNVEITNSRTRWCSDECVESFRSRCDINYIVWLLEQRDKGVCQQCGLDTKTLRQRIRGGRDRAKELCKWHSFKRFGRIEREYAGFQFRHRYWEADHIVPVIKGGGCCGIENYRTLCLVCHKRETAALAAKRAAARARTEVPEVTLSREEAEREVHIVSAKRLSRICSELFERTQAGTSQRLDRDSFDYGFWAGVRSLEGRELAREARGVRT